MEQTAINVIMEQCKAEQITDAELGKWVRTAIYMLHEQEREQLCKMYIQGREDNHLDYYPKKHANETYVEFFGNGE